MVLSLNDQKINNFPTLYLNGIELKKISKLSSILNIRMLGILLKTLHNLQKNSAKNFKVIFTLELKT